MMLGAVLSAAKTPRDKPDEQCDTIDESIRLGSADATLRWMQNRWGHAGFMSPDKAKLGGECKEPTQSAAAERWHGMRH